MSRQPGAGKQNILPLAYLADSRRWVAWQSECQPGEDKPRKLPKNPTTGRNARVPTDPSSYGTRKAAESRWEKIKKADAGAVGGIGIVLGQQIGDNEALMVGVDLDSCRDPKTGEISNITREVIDRFDSYVEISPSKTGVKIFAALTPDDHAALLDMLGFDDEGKQRNRKSFAAGPHREIAIDTARFYAVTEDLYGKRRKVRTVDIDDVRWLFEEIGPRYQAEQRRLNDNGALEYQEFGAETGQKPLDESGSGHGYRFMQECHSRDLSYEEAVAAILEDEGDAGEWASRVNERQLKRAYENSKPKRHKATALNGSVAKPSIIIQRADLIVMRPKQWLWPGRLLRGAQEMFSGQPGLGKSQVQIDWVARATTGRDWPDGASGVKPVDVMMLTAEDTLDQEVVPRLHAAEADLERVHIIKCIRKDKMDRQFLLDEDLNRLRETVLDIGNVGLITIDPITAYMGGKIDSHKTTEVRSQLGPLKDFAEQMNIAISTITHPPKGGGQRAIDSFIGSQAFIAACRIGHLSIEEIEVDEETREKTPTGRLLFCDVKNNAARKGATLAYQIKEVTVSGSNPFDLITAPRILWEKDAVDISADDALAAHAGGGRGRKSDDQHEAQKFLRELLKDGTPVAQKAIIEEATARGFSPKQLRTARETLGIRPMKSSVTGGWEWTLKPPPEPRPAPQGA